MKSKLFLTLLFTVAALTASALTPTYGARLSMDVTIPAGSANLYKNGAGFTVGAVAKLGLPANLYVEPGLMFSYAGMNTKNPLSYGEYDYNGAAKFYGLRIPVNAGYTFKVSPLMAIDVFTGPYLNINLSAQQSYTPNLGASLPEPPKNVNLFKDGWKRVDCGWGIGLGVTFARSYYVGIKGGLSISPLAQYGNKDKKMNIRRSTVSVTLGYNF